jgi:Holliday junction resolvase RusA-like endonuclease
MIKITIHGHLQSLKNRRTSWHGRSPEVARFLADFALQVPPEAKRGIGSAKQFVEAWVVVYYPTLRNDLDCAAVYDALEASGVISNDRWIRRKHETALIDKERPRVEITLAELR